MPHEKLYFGWSYVLSIKSLNTEKNNPLHTLWSKICWIMCFKIKTFVELKTINSRKFTEIEECTTWLGSWILISISGHQFHPYLGNKNRRWHVNHGSAPCKNELSTIKTSFLHAEFLLSLLTELFVEIFTFILVFSLSLSDEFFRIISYQHVVSSWNVAVIYFLYFQLVFAHKLPFQIGLCFVTLLHLVLGKFQTIDV